MKVIHLKYFLAIAGGLMLLACNKTEDPADIGRSYFPDQLQRYYIYQVDSVYVDCGFNIRDTFSYQVKEYYDAAYIDGEGDTAIRLELYRRVDENDNWQITDVWTVKKLPTRVEKVEENNRFVKLTFPVVQDDEWDGNEYNYLDAWYYYYGEVDVAYNNGYLNFDSTVQVTQYNNQYPPPGNLIEMNYFTETFARNVGMVEKVKISFDAIASNTGTCSDKLPAGQLWNTVPIMQRIKEGYVVYYRLTEYGFE